jgi:hypothetical protein
MLRNGLSAHIKTVSYTVGRQSFMSNQIDNVPSGWIGDCLEYVSSHILKSPIQQLIGCVNIYATLWLRKQKCFFYNFFPDEMVTSVMGTVIYGIRRNLGTNKTLHRELIGNRHFLDFVWCWTYVLPWNISFHRNVNHHERGEATDQAQFWPTKDLESPAYFCYYVSPNIHFYLEHVQGSLRRQSRD